MDLSVPPDLSPLMHQYPDFNNRSAVLEGNGSRASAGLILLTGVALIIALGLFVASVFLMPTPPSETELTCTRGVGLLDLMHPSERLFALA